MTENGTRRCVAITGATGFIGQHVARHLLARGHEVRAIVRPHSRRPVPPGATAIQAPLDAGPLAEAFRGAQAVVHLAGINTAARQPAFHKINVDGTRAVAEAARRSGVHVLHVSSLAAAGPASSAHPHSENDPARPATPYGHSKLESERVLAAAAGRWTILRPGPVYGPGDRQLLNLFALAKYGVLPLAGRDEAAYSFIYVEDLVQAIVAVIEENAGNTGSAGNEVMFVGYPTPVTPNDLIDGIRRVVNPRARVLKIPLSLLRAVSNALHIVGAVSGRPLPINRWRYRELAAEGFVCRVDRLRERLGITAQVDLPTGLARTADWYRSEGWI